MLLVATLTVRAAERAAFVRFERGAARVMERHGGRIERVITAPDAADGTFREVHVVRFPDAAAFAAYRADPELAALAPLRAQAVVATVVAVEGSDGPDDHEPAC